MIDDIDIVRLRSIALCNDVGIDAMEIVGWSGSGWLMEAGLLAWGDGKAAAGSCQRSREEDEKGADDWPNGCRFTGGEVRGEKIPHVNRSMFGRL